MSGSVPALHGVSCGFGGSVVRLASASHGRSSVETLKRSLQNFGAFSAHPKNESSATLDQAVPVAGIDPCLIDTELCGQISLHLPSAFGSRCTTGVFRRDPLQEIEGLAEGAIDGMHREVDRTAAAPAPGVIVEAITG